MHFEAVLLAQHPYSMVMIHGNNVNPLKLFACILVSGILIQNFCHKIIRKALPFLFTCDKSKGLTLTIPPSPPSIVCSGPADMMIFYSVSWCQSLFSLLNILFES